MKHISRFCDWLSRLFAKPVDYFADLCSAENLTAKQVLLGLLICPFILLASIPLGLLSVIFGTLNLLFGGDDNVNRS